MNRTGAIGMDLLVRKTRRDPLMGLETRGHREFPDKEHARAFLEELAKT